MYTRYNWFLKFTWRDFSQGRNSCPIVVLNLLNPIKNNILKEIISPNHILQLLNELKFVFPL